MALGSYTPSSDKIVHHTKVDFTKRNSIDQPVRLVQYDNRMPILAVSLFKDNEPYSVPSGYSVNIRVGKKGGKYVYNPALGASNSNQVVYFEITQAMVTDWGKIPVIIELVNGSTVAGSSRITFDIDRNPAQEGDIESSSEGKALVDYVADAKQSASEAEAARDEASESAKRAEAAKAGMQEAVDEAEGYASDAQASKTAAAQSEKNAASANTQAQAAKDTAVQKATDASNSAEAAAGSATSAAQDKQTVIELAEQVATNTETVESNTAKAAASESKAKEYADAASTSAEEAEASNVSAGGHATSAAASAEAAAGSATYAAESQEQIENSMSTFEEYKTSAENSAKAAKESEKLASGYSVLAESSMNEAKTAADTAKTSQTEIESHLDEAEALVAEASGYVDASKGSADAAAKSAEDAETSLGKIQEYELNGETWAKTARSYAVGDIAYREGEDRDNAKYYYEQARTAVNSLTGALKPKGNILFKDLITLDNNGMGDYYNVTDEFTSDETFTDGGNVHYPAGTDVFWTEDGHWNAVQGSGVSGIKGSAESNYRKGLVDISPENVGLGHTLTIVQGQETHEYNGTEDISIEIDEAGKVANPLHIGTKEYDGSKSVTIYSNDIEKVLGYTPIKSDTQGINLIKGTKNWSNENDFVFGEGASISEETYNGFSILHVDAAGEIVRINNIEIPEYITSVTLSFMAKGNGYLTIASSVSSNIGATETAESNGWTKIEFNISIEKNTGGKSSITIRVDDLSMTVLLPVTNYNICELKIELGKPQQNATIWTPNPEEVLTEGDPIKLSNSLTINQGGTSQSFDGSEPITVDIAASGKLDSTLTIGNKTYDGSRNVDIWKSDIEQVIGYSIPRDDTQGINLLKGSKTFNNTEIYELGENATISEETYKGCSILHVDAEGDIVTIKNIEIPNTVKQFTLSLMVMGLGELNVNVTGDINVYTGDQHIDNGDERVWRKLKLNIENSNYSDWRYKTITISIAIDVMDAVGLVYTMVQDYNISMLKLEIGNPPSNTILWTPHPEEVLLESDPIKLSNALTIGGRTYDGSKATKIYKSDLDQIAGFTLSEDTQGINLIKGTKHWNSPDMTIGDSAEVLSEETYNGFSILRIPGPVYDLVTIRNIEVRPEMYNNGVDPINLTLSLMIRGIGFVSIFVDDGRNNKQYFSNDIQIDGTFILDRINNISVNPSDGYITIRVASSSSYSDMASENFDICALKLEYGDVDKPVWTPSPEDVTTKGELEDAVWSMTSENILRGTNSTTVLTPETSSSNWKDGTWNAQSAGNGTVEPLLVTDCPNPNIKNGWKITGNTVGNKEVAQFHVPINSGDAYTISLYAKAISGNPIMQIRSDAIEESGILLKKAISNTKWERFSVTFTPKKNEAYFLFGVTENGGDIGICGMKLEYGSKSSTVWTPAPEDVVTSAKLNTVLNLIFPKNAGAHNSVFRGNNLGTSVTEAQYAAIANGSFDDIFVGDYWNINGRVYRIAGLDILLHTGDTELTTHHAVIVPDINMYSHKMNETSTSAKAYQGSEMKKSGLNTALATVQTAFGTEHILKHKVLLANATSGDNPSEWAWYESQIDLMTERQVYGSPACGQEANNGFDANIQYSRFPLFSLAPEYITSRAWYWLQDVRSASGFCAVSSFGNVHATDAAASGGVHPYFLIGVAAASDEPTDDTEIN